MGDTFWYKWLPIIFGCHCKEDRSFNFKGKKFPICARCTGELVGIICSLLLSFLIRPSYVALVFLMIPMVLDGAVQLITSYESNNLKRLITGILFGYALATIFIMTAVDAYNFGRRIGQTLL